MSTNREACFFWGSIFGTALLIMLFHNLPAQGNDRTTDWGRFALHMAVFAVIVMPGALHQTQNPATATGPRKARRFLLFILGLMPLISLYLGFPSAAQGLTLAQLFDKLSLTLIIMAALSTIWLWYFGPMVWRRPRMRRILIKEFGSVIGLALGLAVLFGVMEGWPVPQVIWVWLFMIGLIVNVIWPMKLPRKHGATPLAKATLLIGEWMALISFFLIVSATVFDPSFALSGFFVSAIGVGVGTTIYAYSNKSSGKPPAHTRRF